jgi:hypothetical protein
METTRLVPSTLRVATVWGGTEEDRSPWLVLGSYELRVQPEMRKLGWKDQLPPKTAGLNDGMI